MAILVALLHFGQSTFTFETFILHSTGIIPPSSPCFLGLMCFFLIFTPFITTLFVLGITSKTSPVFPLSFPDKTLTVSPFFIYYKPDNSNFQ